MVPPVFIFSHQFKSIPVHFHQFLPLHASCSSSSVCISTDFPHYFQTTPTPKPNPMDPCITPRSHLFLFSFNPGSSSFSALCIPSHGSFCFTFLRLFFHLPFQSNPLYFGCSSIFHCNPIQSNPIQSALRFFGCSSIFQSNPNRFFPSYGYYSSR
jgi:hypothetical protein